MYVLLRQAIFWFADTRRRANSLRPVNRIAWWRLSECTKEDHLVRPIYWSGPVVITLQGVAPFIADFPPRDTAAK
jgi:hypothetical protein